MENTQDEIEKMRSAVLAYCEQVCPSNYMRHTCLIEGERPFWVSRSNQRYNVDGKREHVGVSQDGDYWVSGFAINLCGINIPIDGHSSDQDILIAHTILGLQARDAVEAFALKMASRGGGIRPMINHDANASQLLRDIQGVVQDALREGYLSGKLRANASTKKEAEYKDAHRVRMENELACVYLLDLLRLEPIYKKNRKNA